MATQTASPREHAKIEPGLPERRSPLRAAPVKSLPHGDVPILAAAALAAALAVWVTVRGDFLAHPGWLAAQKADIILGPVLVGLYWRHHRPGRRIGNLLIGVGFLSIPYILQSSSAPVAFSLGVLWESVIFLTTLALILAFPSGRLDRAIDRAILLAGAIAAVVPWIAFILLAERVAPSGSLSGCAGPCPANPLQVAEAPDVAAGLLDLVRLAIVVIDVVVDRLARVAPGSGEACSPARAGDRDADRAACSW